MSEQELEKKLIEQLSSQGYEIVNIKNEEELGANFRKQIEKFKKIRETDCYYIDKTKFIEDILIDRTDVKLFCRLRRIRKGEIYNPRSILTIIKKEAIGN